MVLYGHHKIDVLLTPDKGHPSFWGYGELLPLVPGEHQECSHLAGDRQGRNFLCLRCFWRALQNSCSNDGITSPPTA